jgi:IPT/TIG domain
VAGFLTVCGVAGCDRGPTAPSLPDLRNPAPPDVRNPAPTILSVTPSIGSSGGGASILITGSGLLPGIRVAFGETNVEGWFDRYSGGVVVTTPSHAPGSVDVVVTNVDGQNGVAIGAYTFAAPESFDVNGDWRGGSFATNRSRSQS